MAWYWIVLFVLCFLWTVVLLFFASAYGWAILIRHEDWRKW